MSALSSGKINKYEYLKGEEIVLSDHKIEQLHLQILLYEKLWKPRIKTSWSFKSFKTRKNQQDIESIEGIFPKDMRTIEIKSDLKGIKKSKIQ